MKVARFILLTMVLTSSFFFSGCSSDSEEYKAPKFKNETHLAFDRIGEELLCAPSNILATDNYVLVSGYSSPGGATFFVFDKDGNPIRSGINYGRGPAETISGYINMAYYDGRVQYNDLQTGERLSFSLDNFLDDSTLDVEKELLDLPGWCTYYMQTPNGDKLTVISLSASKDPELPQRTIILESSGNTYEFTEPVIEDREIAFFYSLQKSIAFSPNGESMVFSGTPGTIFEFFSLKDGIERLCIKRILPPSVTLSNGSYRQNDDYIFGSGKLCTTDSFVYSAYDGKHTAREWRASNNACLLYNNIAVFDWKGNPKDLYTTDYRIMCLSVENDSTVFACLEDIEGRIFIGKAKLMQ